MAGNISCISIYSTSNAVEQALRKLQTAGCNLRQVSIVGKVVHIEDYPTAFFCAGECIHYWGYQDVFWNKVLGLLTGAAFVWLPGLGPLAAVGQIVFPMRQGLQGIEISRGFSVLAAALYVIGIPRANIREYEQAILARKLLLLVHGSRRDVERVCAILHGETQQVTVHSA